MSTLAIDGGPPVRRDLLRGHRVSAGYEELRQMLEVFDNGKFCSVDPTAPKVPEFERAFADYAGSRSLVLGLVETPFRPKDTYQLLLTTF